MTTVSECWDLYVSEHLSKTVNADRNIRFWRSLKWFSNMDAEGLSSKEVDRYVSLRKLKPGAINRELTMLSGCLNHAARAGKIGRVPHIPRVAGATPRVKALTRDECRALIAGADANKDWRQQVYIRLALATGQRPGAILGLRWNQIDQDGVIDFRDADPRKKRRAVVPANDLAKAGFSLAKGHRNGPLVLHWEDGGPLRDAWELVRKASIRAGVKDVCPYVLRHTVASLLLQEDNDLLRVSRLLGHSNTKITETVYFHHDPSWLEPTTKSLNF